MLYDDIVLFALNYVKVTENFLLKLCFLKKNIVHLALLSDNINVFTLGVIMMKAKTGKLSEQIGRASCRERV